MTGGESMTSSEKFSYWKRPWHRWLILAVGILQLINLWINCQEYHKYLQIHERIFSVAEWEQIFAQELMQCASSGLQAATFLGIFLIGCFAKSKRTARISEGILLLALGVAWSVAGLLMPLTSSRGNTVLWAAITLLALGGGATILWRNARKPVR